MEKINDIPMGILVHLVRSLVSRYTPEQSEYVFVSFEVKDKSLHIYINDYEEVS